MPGNDHSHAVGVLHFVLLALSSFRIAHLVAVERTAGRDTADAPGNPLLSTLSGCGLWVSAVVVTTHWFVVDPAGMYRAEAGTGWPVVVWWLVVLATAASAVIVLLDRLVRSPAASRDEPVHDRQLMR